MLKSNAEYFLRLVISCLRQTMTKAKANAIEKPFRIASMKPKQANMLPNSRGGNWKEAWGELQQLQVGQV